MVVDLVTAAEAAPVMGRMRRGRGVRLLGMRVIVVTGTSSAQKYFASAIAAKNDVVAVLHPTSKPPITARQIIASRGKVLTRVPLVSGWDQRRATRVAAAQMIPDADESYVLRCRRVARTVTDVNSADSIRSMLSLRPDVVLCFGGPIYGARFIEAFPAVLNYHTGLSPIYNGAASIYFAFANGHFACCGGTLMRMSRRIDGGEILGHVRPAIASNDTPATLFLKAVQGGAMLSNALLADIQSGWSPVTSVPQHVPKFYYRGRDWSLRQTWSIAAHLRSRSIARFAREQELHAYWLLGASDASRVLDLNVKNWLQTHALV